MRGERRALRESRGGERSDKGGEGRRVVRRKEERGRGGLGL